MSSINATFSSSPSVSATVSGGTVLASLSSGSSVSATVLSGFGPQGPQGPSGVNAISQASDVQIVSATLGDVLWYSRVLWRTQAHQKSASTGNESSSDVVCRNRPLRNNA